MWILLVSGVEGGMVGKQDWIIYIARYVYGKMVDITFGCRRVEWYKGTKPTFLLKVILLYKECIVRFWESNFIDACIVGIKRKTV